MFIVMSGPFKCLRTPEGEQRARWWVELLEQGGVGVGTGAVPGLARTCSSFSPLVPVLQLQRVHDIISSVRLGAPVSPL